MRFPSGANRVAEMKPSRLVRECGVLIVAIEADLRRFKETTAAIATVATTTSTPNETPTVHLLEIFVRSCFVFRWACGSVELKPRVLVVWGLSESSNKKREPSEFVRTSASN